MPLASAVLSAPAGAGNATVPLTLADLDTAGEEPRVMDLRLAEVLGFERTNDIRKLISRHLPALKRLGKLCATVARILKDKGNSPSGGRPGKAYWLTKKQALYICTKSETPNATEATVQMVEVFDAWLAGRLPPAPSHPDPAIPHVDGRYLVHVVGGRVNLVTDVRDACVVNGSNPVNVMTFLREYLDPAVFPVALETIAYRASVCLRHGPKGAPVPSIFRAPEPSHEARVLSIIRTAGRISRTDLLMKMKHRMKAAELDRVLMALERSGRIRVDTPSPPVGRPPFWYAAA